jgi:hypothetical protein
MSGHVFVRGGFPKMISGTTAANPTVEHWDWQGGRSMELVIENDSTTDLLVSFNADDAAAHVWITIPHTVGSPGNPFQARIEATEIWTYAAGAVAFKVLALLGRA